MYRNAGGYLTRRQGHRGEPLQAKDGRRRLETGSRGGGSGLWHKPHREVTHRPGCGTHGLLRCRQEEEDTAVEGRRTGRVDLVYQVEELAVSETIAVLGATTSRGGRLQGSNNNKGNDREASPLFPSISLFPFFESLRWPSIPPFA